MRTKIFFNLLRHNVLSFIKQVNVTDIVNKSSVSFFFIITKVAKKNSGVVVQDTESLHGMQKQA